MEDIWARAAESAAFFRLLVPGETVMVLGGVLAGLGQVGLVTMMTSAVAWERGWGARDGEPLVALGRVSRRRVVEESR